MTQPLPQPGTSVPHIDGTLVVYKPNEKNEAMAHFKDGRYEWLFPVDMLCRPPPQ